MDITGDSPRSAPVTRQQHAPPDVSSYTLLDLLISGNASITEAAERLLAERIEYQEQVLLGWSSVIEAMPRSDS